MTITINVKQCTLHKDSETRGIAAITDLVVLIYPIDLLCALLICDMIKRNESDVGHIVFEILAKTVFKFLCFILFLALTNPS